MSEEKVEGSLVKMSIPLVPGSSDGVASIVVDGVDITNAVRSITLYSRAGEVTEVWMGLVPGRVEVDAECLAHLLPENVPADGVSQGRVGADLAECIRSIVARVGRLEKGLYNENEHKSASCDFGGLA